MAILECEDMIDIKHDTHFINFINITANKKFCTLFDIITEKQYIEYPQDNPIGDTEVLKKLFNKGCVAVWDRLIPKYYIFSDAKDAFNKFSNKEGILIKNMEQWKKILKIVVVPLEPKQPCKIFMGVNCKITFSLVPNYMDEIEWCKKEKLYIVKED